ncbi:hypothetical protein Tco_1435157 [Tanacetum coccineum]
MVNEMQQWLVREEDDIDATIYDIYKDLFSMKVHHGGSFTPKGRREYVLGNISFVDLLGINSFSVYIVDDIVKELEYSSTGMSYYHFMIPTTNLDYGLVALGSDHDVKELLKYVSGNKLIELYIEHDTKTLDTYSNGHRDGVITDELDDNMPPSPTISKGFTKLCLETPSSSKPLTIGEDIQLNYEERVRKRIIHIKGPFNPRPGVIYLGNPHLLRQGEIPWVNRENCGEDIGCSSSKGKELEL